MFKTWWHKLFGHKWEEMAFTTPEVEGVRPRINNLFRRCSCGAVQCAQVIGEPLAASRYVTTGVQTDELAALRKMAGL